MNREIKFRGIDENGIYRFGLLSYSILGHTLIVEYSYDKYYSSSYIVKPETLGQLTGLKDKNGKEIYEGDLLSCPFGTHSKWSKYRKEKLFNFPVIFTKGKFDIKIDKIGIYRFFPEIEEDCEIIGNIHEHPHLILS